MTQLIQAYGHTIEFPDGMSQTDIESALKANALNIKPDYSIVPEKPNLSVAQTLPAWQRASKGAADVLTGPAQMLYNAMPQAVRNAGDTADQWLYEKTGGRVGLAPGMNLNQGIQAQEAEYQKARGSSGIDWLRMGGNLAGAAPLAAVLPAQSGVTGGALMGTLYSGLQPVTDENYGKAKLGQMGTGAAVGGAVSGLGSAAASVLAPKVRPELQTLLDANVRPSLGQTLGGGFNRAEEAATSIPVLGDMIKGARIRAAGDLNTAAINRALSPIGDSLPKGVSGRSAIDYAASKIGGAYDSVLGRIGAVRPDERFAADLDSLGSLTKNLAKDKSEQFDRIVQNEIIGRVKSGLMTGEDIKAAESNLGAMAKDYLRAPDYDTRKLGTAIQEAQASIRSMLQRAKPDLADELQSINSAYANFLRPQRASSMIGAEDGIFSAEQLQQAVRALDSTKHKIEFGRKSALMQDLSEAGKSVLGSKVPDSGTPLRHAVELGVGGLIGHQVLPATVSSALVPAAALGGLLTLPYTKLGQAASTALLTKRPEFAPALADQLRFAAPYLGMASPGLLN